MSYHASTTFRDWQMGPLRLSWHRYRCCYDDLRHWNLSIDWVRPSRTTFLVDWTSPRCEHA